MVSRSTVDAEPVEDRSVSISENLALPPLVIPRFGSDSDGDIYYYASGILHRLPLSTAGSVLGIVSGLPAWVPGSSFVTQEVDPTVPAYAKTLAAFSVIKSSTDAIYPQLNGTGATGTWGISISGNSNTVTNGVYISSTYNNPSWLASLDYSKLLNSPTNLNQFTNGPGYITAAYTGYDTRYYPLSTNPAGYLTSFTETDPTVPAYAKTLSAFSVIKSSTDPLYAPISGSNNYFQANPPAPQLQSVGSLGWFGTIFLQGGLTVGTTITPVSGGGYSVGSPSSQLLPGGLTTGTSGVYAKYSGDNLTFTFGFSGNTSSIKATATATTNQNFILPDKGAAGNYTIATVDQISGLLSSSNTWTGLNYFTGGLKAIPVNSFGATFTNSASGNIFTLGRNMSNGQDEVDFVSAPGVLSGTHGGFAWYTYNATNGTTGGLVQNMMLDGITSGLTVVGHLAFGGINAATSPTALSWYNPATKEIETVTPAQATTLLGTSGFRQSTKTVTAYTVAEPGDFVIRGDVSGGTFSVNLPTRDRSITTSTVPIPIGLIYVITKVDSTATALTVNGCGKNIQSSSSMNLTSQYQTIWVQYNGVNWDIISKV